MTDYIQRTDEFMKATGLPEVYRVGGSVRDEILGRRIKDADYMVRGVDLATLGRTLDEAVDHYDFVNESVAQGSVSPLKLRDGRQAGWRVAAKGLGVIEIVLPRTEISRPPMAGENRHRAFDIVVDPTIPVEEDAKRRDFTFNALYKVISHPVNMRLRTTLPDGRPLDDVLDPTGDGVTDLLHRMVRTTHPSSFRDDPLRTLRALRFVSTLGYDLETRTAEQMTHYHEYVTGLSAKGYASGTVLDEMSKLLMGQEPAKALRIARDTGVLATLFPELADMLGHDPKSRYHDLNTDEHTFRALETAAHVDASLRVRWALLFHDCGKPEVEWTDEKGESHFYSKDADTEDHEKVGARRWRAAAKRMNAPAQLREQVTMLILHHMVDTRGKLKPQKIRRMRVTFGDSLLSDLFLHRVCDFSAKNKVDKHHIQRVLDMERVRVESVQKHYPASTKDLMVGGHDVMERGITGRQVGVVLNQILDEVVVDPSSQKLSREWQLGRIEPLRYYCPVRN